jgi:hypothetical protein
LCSFRQAGRLGHCELESLAQCPSENILNPLNQL